MYFRLIIKKPFKMKTFNKLLYKIEKTVKKLITFLSFLITTFLKWFIKNFLRYLLIFPFKKKILMYQLHAKQTHEEKLAIDWKHLAQQLSCQTDLLCNDQRPTYMWFKVQPSMEGMWLSQYWGVTLCTLSNYKVFLSFHISIT